MPARLSCPDCGAVAKLDDDLPPGERIKCRKCGTVYRVPDDDEAYDDDDDGDRAPRRRRRRRQESGSGVVVGVIVGVVLLICVGIGAVGLWAAFSGKKDTAVADANPAGQPPPPPVQGRGGIPPGGILGGQPPNTPPRGGQPPLAAGPQVGQPAPEIEAEDLDGKKFKLSDYKGKVVLLDFWGHW